MCRLHEYKAMTRMQVAATLDRAQSMLDMHDKSRSYKQQDARRRIEFITNKAGANGHKGSTLHSHFA